LAQAGRPKLVVDIPKIVELANAGVAVRAIAQELNISRTLVNRVQRTAQNEGLLGVKRRQPKTVAATVAMTTTLDRRDRFIVLYSLSVTIEHEIRALERCQQLRGGSGVTEAIQSRERALKELCRTRQRLLTRVQ